MTVEWFLPIVVGCLVWAYLSVGFNRRNIDELKRKARKAGWFSSRAEHRPFKR